LINQTIMSPSPVSCGNEGHDVAHTELQTRRYQYEMFEKSMKGNVIIAMDTGSGKTHIAILRIAAELERCSPEKVGQIIEK
jgi:ERCC4-related helicase